MELLKKVITSIPFISEKQFEDNLEELTSEYHRITSVEVRFDYYSGAITDNLIDRIKNLIESHNLQMVFTYFYDDLEENYFSIVQRLIKHKPHYIDLDSNIKQSVLAILAEIATQEQVPIIYSYHDWDSTPQIDTISDLCEYFIQLLPKFSWNEKNILKMVFMVKNKEDNTTLHHFYSKYAQGVNLICFGMGELGKLTRIQSIRNGCVFTYGHISKPTAPGQLHISEIQNYVNKPPIS